MTTEVGIAADIAPNTESGPQTVTGESAEPAKSAKWEPKILTFCCTWCSYQAADLAGTSRHKYASNVRLVRVPCSGRVDPWFVLKAFEEGADGVLVTGCHPGDCHYQKGNLFAEGRFEKLSGLVEMLGIGSKRVRLEWVSAAEGDKFAKTADEFTRTIKELGPLP